jgi:hypothetical protein
MKHLVALVPFLLLPGLAWAQKYDSGDPTAAEQVVLESINRARSNPTAEGARLSVSAVSSNSALVAGLPGVTGIPGGDITEGLVAPNNVVGARPPLAMNKILLGTARAHNTDMYNNNIFQHNSSGGIDPGTRMDTAGYTWKSGGMSGENIAEAGSPGGGLVANSDQLENILMIDNGIAGRGHRVNLLDTHTAPFFREIGVGYLHNDTPTATPLFMTDLVTEDFGTLDSAPGPFLVGVIFNDANSNSIYDSGEGISGITINILNGGSLKSAFAVSATAGGYVVPITGLSGTLTVQISGGSLASAFSTDIGLSGENVKVDFIIKGGVASVAPSSVFPAPGSGGSGSGGGGGGGGCGLLGLEGVLALAFLRRRRR